ncbi:MAG: hypothetical protein ACOC22_01875 [bacterium]
MTKKILIGFLIFIGIIFLSLGLRYTLAPIKGKVEQRETVESGDFRMYSYEHFHNLFGVIQANQTELETQEYLLKEAESQNERERIRSNIAGIRSQMRRNVERYNSDARQIKTRGKFRDDDLPYEIELENNKLFFLY